MNTLVTITLEAITCYRRDCGLVFGIEQGHYVNLTQNHGWFYCPNGHSQHFTSKSDAEKERDRAEQLSQELARANTRALRYREDAEHEARRRAAAKGQLTKLKNRIANGVCPCCNRYFPALQRHVAQEHPDYVLPEGVTLAAST